MVPRLGGGAAPRREGPVVLVRYTVAPRAQYLHWRDEEEVRRRE